MQNAVWVYFRQGFNPPESVQEFVAWAKAYDVKVVLLHVEGKKYADGPLVETQIQEFIEGCIQHELEVHGMFNALTSVPDAWIQAEYKDLFCVDYHGISILDEPISGRRLFMDPKKPEVVELLKQITANILKSYPGLCGIQLDFIRYYHMESTLTMDAKAMGHNVSILKQGNPLKLQAGDSKVSYFLHEAHIFYDDPPLGDRFVFQHKFSYCFCDECLKGFSRTYGVEIPEALEQTSEKGQWILDHAADKWYDYRCSILEAVVREVYLVVKAVDAKKQFSITVWYNSPYGNELMNKPLDPLSVVRDFGQNWWSWVNRGYLDFVCPMNYWLKPEGFGDVTKEQVATIQNKVPLYSGLLRSDEYPLDSAGLEAYKVAAKDAGAQGICFFHYGTWRNLP